MEKQESTAPADIGQKLDAVLAGQNLLVRMLTDLIGMLDERRHDSEKRRHAVTEYMDGVSGMMERSGAPPELVANFKNLFNRSFIP